GVRSNHGYTYMCHNAFRDSLPSQPAQCFASPAPIVVGNVFLSSDAVQTWYDAVDRKSTRLNSSHLVISCAVFCLKKKKKIKKNNKHDILINSIDVATIIDRPAFSISLHLNDDQIVYH